MANEIIPKSAKQIQQLENLYERAISLVDEVDGMASMTYSVASAGRAFCGEDQPSEQNIFSVIELLTQDTKLTSALRGLIEELARAAGLEIACEVTNGC